MKRAVTILLTFVMVLSMAVTVFAANSPENPGAVTVSSAVDASGNAVKLAVESNSTAQTAAAELTAAELKSVIGNDYNDKMSVLNVVDVQYTGTAYPVTVTFNVSGVKSTDKVVVLHKAASGWEVVKATVGNGTVTATFNSLSPVAFVVDSTATNKKSPDTGNNVMPFVFVALIASVGAAYAAKRSSANA